MSKRNWRGPSCVSKIHRVVNGDECVCVVHGLVLVLPVEKLSFILSRRYIWMNKLYAYVQSKRVTEDGNEHGQKIERNESSQPSQSNTGNVSHSLGSTRTVYDCNSRNSSPLPATRV